MPGAYDPGVALPEHMAPSLPLGGFVSASLTNPAAAHLAPLSGAHSGCGMLVTKMGVSAQEPRNLSGLVGLEDMFSMPLGYEAGAE